MKSKRHTVTLSVRFDKPCTKEVALRELRDTIFGKNYCTQFTDEEPGEYRVTSIKPVLKTDLAAELDKLSLAELDDLGVRFEW